MGYKFNPFTGTLDAVDSPIGSSGQVIYNNGGALAGISTLTFDGTSVTLAGRLINSYTSLASAPAKVFTGTWFTGGTSTTTKPHFLIEPTGTTSTAWSTSGTGLGVNAASGFNGRLLDLQTNGTSRMVVQGDGKVGIGVTTAGHYLEIRPSANDGNFFVGNNSGPGLQGGYSTGSTAAYLQAYNTTSSAFTDLSINGSTLRFGSGSAATERARIDSSGRLLVGTSTSTGSNNDLVQSHNTTGNNYAAGRFSNTGGGPDLNFYKSRGGSVGINTTVQGNDVLGNIAFLGANDSTYLIGATISAAVDGVVTGGGANDMPGRLVFSVTADGAPSPTEAMRIKNTRVINFSNAPVYADNAAAKTGGLVDGDVYRTSAGDLKIVYT